MRVAVVGAGRVGTGMAVLLQRAGHRIEAVSGRGPTRDRAARYLPGVPVLEAAAAAAAGELVVLGVPDDLIESTAEALADAGVVGPGRWVAHLSGARGLDALAAVRGAGGGRLAIHPLQTFPDVVSAIEGIPDCAVAVTADDDAGYRVAERIADDLLGVAFRLDDDLRARYHAAAVFASNYLVATSAVAADLFASAGVPDPVRAMHPLQRTTLDNVARLGPGVALTGPAVRGDAGTIERNLQAVAEVMPEAVPAYVALARVALDLAVRAGRLDGDARMHVDEVLDRWS
jgi:predicted short-subunit dehydrogenase-like oxidoreductase (DUF2520 family)